MSLVAIERHCPECGAAIAQTSRPDRKFCGAACRQAAYERRRGRSTSSSAEVPSVAGTSRVSTLEDWERAVEEGREEEFLLGLIVQAAEKPSQWKAAAWILERRWPSRWGPVRRGETRPSEPEAFSEADNPLLEIVALARRRQNRKRRGS